MPEEGEQCSRAEETAETSCSALHASRSRDSAWGTPGEAAVRWDQKKGLNALVPASIWLILAATLSPCRQETAFVVFLDILCLGTLVPEEGEMRRATERTLPCVRPQRRTAGAGV